MRKKDLFCETLLLKCRVYFRRALMQKFARFSRVRKFGKKRTENCEASHRIKFVDSVCELVEGELANLSWRESESKCGTLCSSRMAKQSNRTKPQLRRSLCLFAVCLRCTRSAALPSQPFPRILGGMWQVVLARQSAVGRSPSCCFINTFKVTIGRQLVYVQDDCSPRIK